MQGLHHHKIFLYRSGTDVINKQAVATGDKSTRSLPEAFLEVTTPLRGAGWEQELASHPDKRFAAYVVHGIKHGFRVGFD